MTTPPAPTAAQRHRSFVRAFLESVVGTGLSRVLGAARDITLAGVLGAGPVADAFFVAYTIPGVFRRFVADEGLTGALIPTLSRAEADQGEAGARRLANSTLTMLLLANLLLCALGIWAAEPLVLAFAYSFRADPDQLALAVALTRWMFPFVAMVSLVSYFEALLNFRGHFFVPKIAPGLASGGIVAGALLFTGAFSHPVWAVVAGLLVGGTAHVLVNLPWVWKRWGAVGLGLDLRDPLLHTLLREIGKVVVIGLFAQLNIIVLRQLATAVGDGAVTWYWNATRIVDLATGAIAVAVGGALLPNISAAVAQHDWDHFRDALVHGFRLAGFVLIPAAVVLSVFALPLTAILFRHGAYTWEDTQHTAATMRLLVPFMLAIGGMNILKRVYYALEDRRTLLAVGAAGVGLTGAVGWLLVDAFGVPGLALSLSIATVTQLLVYVLVLRRRLGTRLGLDRVVSPYARMLIASLPVAGVLLLAAWAGDWSQGPAHPLNLALVAGGLACSVAAYLFSAKRVGLSEYDALVGRLLRPRG